MNSHNVAPKRKRKATLVALVTAGMLSAAGTGSILLGLSGTTSGTEVGTVASHRPSVNIDSLYDAKANETTKVDSSYAQAITPDQTLNGHVSWYGPGFHGRRTASGERFDSDRLTAAHRTLPFGTILRLADSKSGRAILVRVTDRGPFCRGRLLDVSEGAASRLGIKGRGTADVQIEVFSHDQASSTMTFDRDGRAVAPHGFSVLVKETQNFDEAYALQQSLNNGTEDRAFLTEIRNGGQVYYKVCLGLFSSQRLCQSLATDLASDYVTEVIRFDKGSLERFDLAQSDFAGN